MKPVVIFGTGQYARLAYTYFRHDSAFEVAAFAVHEQYLEARMLLDREVVPFERLDALYPPAQCDMFVAVGYSRMNKTRAGLYEACRARGYRLVSYVNTKAVFWGDLRIGDNCFILEHNVIQPFVEIGNDVVLWSGNHVGHDSTIGDHCFVASHAVISGNVTVGAYCFVGVNATIRDGVTVAPECLIGAGALILKNTREAGVYRGAASEPARVSTRDLRHLG